MAAPPSPPKRFGPRTGVAAAEPPFGLAHASTSNPPASLVDESRQAVTLAPGDPFSSLVVDSLFVGETDNIGNPVTRRKKPTAAACQSARFPTFRSADTSATITVVKGAKFVNAKPVHFPKIDPRFDNDNRGGVAWRTAMIHDLDGSVGGVRNSYILSHDGENDGVATDEKTCTIQRSWNAAVCTGDIGRLFLNKPGGTLAELSAASPVTLGRNGKNHKITGNQSIVRSGTAMRVNTERQEFFSVS